MSIVDFGVSPLRAEELTQWDYGQVLEFVNIDLPDGVEVHFAAERSCDAIVVVSRKEKGNTVADIPQELLEQPASLVAYVYVDTKKTGKTIYKIEIPIFARQKPEDYIYTPTEKKEWEKLEEGIDTLSGQLGELGNLATTDKSSVVNAVNELESSKLSKNLGIINFTGTSTELDAELERIHKEQPTNTRYQFQLRLLDMTETHSVLGKYVYFVEGWKYTNGGTYGSGRQRFATYGGEVICHKRFTGNNVHWETTLVAKDVEAIVAKDTNATSKTVDFEEDTARHGITTGETLGGLFGKISKWLKDLGTSAFRGVSNVLTTTADGYVLDARQGKVLADRVGDIAKLETTNKTSLVNAINEVNSKTLQPYDFKGTSDELDAELVRIHKEQPMHSRYQFEIRLLDMTEVHSVIPKAVYYVEGWKYSNSGDYGSGEQTFKSYNQNNIYMKRFGATASTWRTITTS